MLALLFGANGQDGHYLRGLLEERGIGTVCASRTTGEHQGNVADFGFVQQLMRSHVPDYVLHLAARSSTAHEALFDNHAAIVTGTLNILEAVRLHAPGARVFIAGSGLQFRNTGAPISPRDPFEASSAYSAARISSVYAARYFRTLGLRIYIGYLFHHESPLRRPHHMASYIAQTARRISRGESATLEIGDPAVEKEWTYAGDVAAGILQLMNQDRVFEACIGSGVAHSIQDWIEACFSRLGIDWRPHLRIKKDFTPEFRRLVSDPAEMLHIGWHPTVSFEALAAMMTEDA